MAAHILDAVHDFTTPASNLIVDIPAGYTMAEITVVGVGLSTSGSIAIRASSGGVETDLLFRVFIRTAALVRTVEAGSGGALVVTATGTTGLDGSCIFCNLNVTAPLYFRQTYQGSGAANRGAISTSAQIVNQIFIKPSAGGTINAGKIYVRLYNRTIKLTSYDFATPATTFDISGLKPTTSGLVVVAGDGLVTTPANSIRWRESLDGGSSFVSTGYQDVFINVTDGSVLSGNIGRLGGVAKTTDGIAAEFWGLPLLFPSTSISTSMFPAATDAEDVCARQTVAGVADVLRLRGSSLVNYTAGIVYVSEYAM